VAIPSYENVSVINTTTYTVTATVNLENLSYPQEVVVTADRTKVYVTNDVDNSVFLIIVD
jgi:YVTN family beta-propeller protein